MNEVFISYKAEEYDEANWVKSVLEENGISCWMAPESMPGGSNYAVEIPKAIRACKVFVLILSSKSQSSQWVAREVDRAINEGKVVLPFMLENCELKDDFNFYLTNVQRYNAYENKLKAIERMHDEIKAILGIDKADIKADVKSQQASKINSNDDVEISVVPKKASKKQKKETDSSVNKSKNKFFAKKKRPLIIAITIVAFIVLCIVGSVTLFKKNEITIAGETFKKDDWSITLKDKVLTDTDMSNFATFNDLDEISFTNCTFPSTNISVIFEKANGKVILDNCGITNAHMNSFDFEELNEDFSSLKLDNNPDLTDISMIFTEASYGFEEITINNCAVSDISCLSGEYNFTLQKFEADNNGIIDISALSYHNQLEHLSLAGNKIASLQPLSSLSGLKYINVVGNKLTNLEGLESSIYLEMLYAGNNSITNLDGISNCTLLGIVDIGQNQITDISILSKSLATLQNVNLANNSIEDISALNGSIKLQELNIDNNKITSLTALDKSTELSKLSAANNKISAVSGITNCRFRSLNLANNQLTSVEGIVFYSGSKTLEEAETVAGVTGKTFGLMLDLSHNQITSITLKLSDVGSVSFDEIKLYGNDISNISNLERVTVKQLVIQYNENLDFSQLNKNDVFKYYIIGCPLDKQVAVAEIMGSDACAFCTEQEYLQTLDSK